MEIEQSVSAILQRNLSSFHGVRNGILMDCTHPVLLAGLENAFHGFSNSISEHVSIPGEIVEVGVLPEVTDDLDALMIVMPKSKEMLKLILAWARYALPAGASVFLVGPKKTGVESGAKLLKCLGGDPTKLDSARHCQLWQCELQPEAKSNEFSLQKWESSYQVAINDTGTDSIVVTSLPGVFSEKRLDPGSDFLLSVLSSESFHSSLSRPPQTMMDFACGSGVITAFLAKQYPHAKLYALDNSALATYCTARTLRENTAQGKVLLSNGFTQCPDALQLDLIVSNPPFHTGTKTDYSIVKRFILNAKRYLRPNGAVVLVSNRFLQYGGMLKEHFNEVSCLAENNAYSVHLAIHR